MKKVLAWRLSPASLLLWRSPTSRADAGRHTQHQHTTSAAKHEISQLPVRSLCTCCGLRPRQGSAPRNDGAAHVAFERMKTLGPRDIDLSRLNPTPPAIAVYASSPLSPAVTQRSLLSGRYPYLGRT